MDSNSKRRMQYNQDEMERRRTDRARQRSEIMNQRRQAAQTQYMDRMAERAGGRGASPQAVNAIRYGETIGQNQDRRQGYMTAAAQRNLVNANASRARMEGKAGIMGARTGQYAAETDRMGLGETARQFDTTTGLSRDKFEFEKDVYQREDEYRWSQPTPGIKTGPGGEKFILNRDGSVEPYFTPGAIGKGGDRAYIGAGGDVTLGDLPKPVEPLRMESGELTEFGFKPAPRYLVNGEVISADEKFDEFINRSVREKLGKGYTQEEYLKEYSKMRDEMYGAP